MITVGKLAERFGLSRTTLLYYERNRLLRSTARSRSGYRLYGEDAVARLRLISTYKSAGLPLAEIRRLLDAPDTAAGAGCGFKADDMPGAQIQRELQTPVN